MKDVLIVGVGNILLSDEGVGVHVARQLMGMRLPHNVEVIDGGTAGFELIRFFEGRSKVIIIDAIKTKDEAGAVFRLRPEEFLRRKRARLSCHEDGLWELLQQYGSLNARPELVVIGVVPMDADHLRMSLSPVIRRKLGSIVRAVLGEANNEEVLTGHKLRHRS